MRKGFGINIILTSVQFQRSTVDNFNLIGSPKTYCENLINDISLRTSKISHA